MRIILDDTDGTRTGTWKPSTFFPGFYGKGYVHDDNSKKGKSPSKPGVSPYKLPPRVHVRKATEGKTRPGMVWAAWQGMTLPSGVTLRPVEPQPPMQGFGNLAW